MSTSLKFTATTGHPTVIHLTDEDGRRYELKLQLSILDVIKTDRRSESDLPVFQAQAHIVTETVEIKP